MNIFVEAPGDLFGYSVSKLPSDYRQLTIDQTQ